MQTIAQINAVLRNTGWRVELGEASDRSEFLRLYRKAGKTWADAVFVTSFPRDTGAGVIAACAGVAKHYFALGQAAKSPK